MAVIKVKPTSPGRRAVVKVVHKHYHAPISNTGAGVLVLENTFI